jgi:cation-transporting ATPase E
VAVKIISGDNPATVAAVAREAGVLGIEGAGFDARNLPDDIDELATVLEANTVFGRVTPEQKRNMVSALQSRGHVVAMTGDGVNDALALKRADLGIAMGSGSPATKAVSNLVLLDGKFSTLPGVVAEGRRVIANVERVSRLFLTKTMWALVLAFTFGALLREYPFLPRQLSVVDVFTIGVPSFVLALLPNARRYEPGFLKRALSFCIPSGLTIGAAILTLDLISHSSGWSDSQQQTATMILISMTGLWTLTLLARPLDKLKGGIIALMLGLAAVAFGWQQFGAFFGFVQLGWAELSLPVALALAANALISISDRFAPKPSDK